MVKGKWQGIVFIFLILLLAIGLSTVALNERTEQEAEKVHKMAIALVNEDTGTDFNDSSVNFGNEFANQINQNEAHDWFIVSRGVAESGFERSVYDMMIVIPNNFSENALSIDEDAPEQVTLEYKINATGHEDVRADAEKAAGQVLTNFNKQLIDVFFVSIIGNLQEAQDNIADIIAKEKEYTDEYTVNIFNPLDNFTNQFERIQQYADMSKNNYNQLDDVLNNFETNLSDKAQTNAEYDQDIAEALQQKEESSLATSRFAEQFDQFYAQMTREEAFEQLMRVNGELYNRFKNNENENNKITLQDRINQLNNRFDELRSEVDNYEEFVLNDLMAELRDTIDEGVNESFAEDTMGNIKLIDLIKDLDANILENINHSIAILPEDAEKIRDLVLPDTTKTKLKNIALISEAFEDDEEFPKGSNEEQPGATYSLLEKPFKNVYDTLTNDGIEVTNTIKIDNYKDTVFNYSLNAPKGFNVEKVVINEQSVSEPKGEITLEQDEGADDLTVDIIATFVLNKEYDEIDFWQPITWTWTLDQYNEETETIIPEEPDNNDNPNSKPDEQMGQSDGENNETGQFGEQVGTLANEVDDNNADSTEDQDGESSSEGESDTSAEDNGDENNLENPVDPEDPEDPEKPETPGQPADPQEPIIKEKTIHQYYWNQSVQTPLFDQKQLTGDLIDEAVGLYEAIDSLNTMYDLYFGLDLSKENEGLEQELNNKGLAGLAKGDSLYYLVHKKEIKNIIQDQISNDVIDSVTESMNAPLTVFHKDIQTYQEDLKIVREQSSNLAGVLEEASTEATNLNDHVKDVLNEVDTWRNNSNELMDEQMDVLTQDSDMQTVLLSLDSGFKPILSTSESLAEQAKSNFDSTEQVYETLDSIDEQADTIQRSGTTLVSQANELASKFSEKAAEDMDFADNFNEVLANSRIGDRQNEDLYSFLSNPVESQNTGLIDETKSFTPYFIVFIMAIVSFFTAYGLSNHRNVNARTEEFETDQTFIQNNIGSTMLTGGIGLIEGLLIGIISFILLDIPQTDIFTWIALITVMMLAMVLIATYALRQLRMIGMFLLLVVFSLYLLLTKSLGFQFGGNETIRALRTVSPLQQLESWLHAFIEGTMSTTTLTTAFIILIVAGIIGLALNLLIIDTTAKEVGMDDERTKEAN